MLRLGEVEHVVPEAVPATRVAVGTVRVAVVAAARAAWRPVGPPALGIDEAVPTAEKAAAVAARGVSTVPDAPFN
ncbi:hypothetical protein A5634_10060 [Mycobacterium asiaticum]|uniref:Uncharacterized protein n=1 Tax=Mycobacterium asiaticum TaxID=1790 RepID=A0A1A3NMK6_MYCAS|nr:hypothetical protein [Mycobacterium asiaticum]OBK21572.1 hypothetical protein A5634_10060 [Mycobacterium asiaticum]